VKAIVIGFTSGIGCELAKQMSIMGYIIGITGRRSVLLDSLARFKNGVFWVPVDELVLSQIDSNLLEFTHLS
jgi:short-subunit dehydrogenase